MVLPRADRGLSIGPAGKCWLGIWGRKRGGRKRGCRTPGCRTPGCRTPLLLCCCRRLWASGCGFNVLSCRSCWCWWICCSRAGFGLSSWPVTMVTLPDTSVSLAVLFLGSAPSALIGCSWPESASLQRENMMKFSSSKETNCRKWMSNKSSLKNNRIFWEPPTLHNVN